MKKQLRFVLALVLCFALLCSMFAACAKTEEPSKPAASNDTKPAASNDTKPADSKTDTPADNDSDEEDEEPTEILFCMFDMRGTGGDYGDAMREAVKEYCIEKINVAPEIQLINSGDWANKVSVAVSAGERIDVCSEFGGMQITRGYPMGLLLDATDYLNEYAPETLELLKDYIGTYTYNGRIYGLPTLRNYAKNGYILFNKPVLEEVGMVEQAKAIKSWSDYEAVLKAIKEGYADAHGVFATRGATGDFLCTNYVCNGDSFDDYILFDSIGDSCSVVFTDFDGNVSLYQDQPGWVNEASIMADWMNKGYVWPDSLFTTEFVDDGMKQGVFSTFICGSEEGVEVTKTNSLGFEVLAVKTVTGMIKTSQPTFTGVGLPYTCEEPEAACKFLNLMYTDETLMNLLIWGVEGVDYTVEDDQVAHSADGGYYLGVDFILGNALLLKPLLGNGADFYEKVKVINSEAMKSPYLGFSLNSTGLDGYIGQISAVNDQYLKTFTGGGYTPELYAEYVDKLHAAEVDAYLDVVQEQLTAWLAEH